MKWLLVFLAACGGSDAGLLDLGEASVRPIDASKVSTPESSAETSRTGTTTSTDATTVHGDSEALSTEASLLDTSTKPIMDAGSGESIDAPEPIDSGDCNLSCEPMCIRLMMPMHACCSPRQQCNCTTADAGSVCAN